MIRKSSRAFDSEDAVEIAGESVTAEIIALADPLGMQIEKFVDITRLTSPLQKKRSFRLDLAGGRCVKARSFPNRARQQRFISLSPLFKELPFAHVLAHGGRVTLEEWVEGVTLDPRRVTARQAYRGGEILGELHSLAGYDDSHRLGIPDTDTYLLWSQQHLSALTSQGLISENLSFQLIALALDHQPDIVDSGVIHADFCADNMILVPSDELFLVDNEDVRVGVLDYDLARCWSRWPMTANQRSEFCAGYGQYRSVDNFITHQVFWGVVALAKSLFVLLRHGRTKAGLKAALSRIASGEIEDFWPRP